MGRSAMTASSAPILAHLLMAGLVRRAQLSWEAACGTALPATWARSQGPRAAAAAADLAMAETMQAARNPARPSPTAVAPR